MKNFIKRNTPTRPDLKPELISLQEKERQRLESLRKKQEAEEQRKKKVEEEKRRRQAEMKQKREERLRKALQARERVEQMEEEKKKRVEQKLLQNDEKVRLSQAREEKAAEEQSKKKLSKKPGEADARKQKALRGGTGAVIFLLQEEDEFEQQEPLQKRREDEGKEKGKKVLELKKLVEQQQAEQAKERVLQLLWWVLRLPYGNQQGKGLKVVTASLSAVTVCVCTDVCAGCSSCWCQSCGACEGSRCVAHGRPGLARQAGSPAPCSHLCCLWLQKSISASCLGPPRGRLESASRKVNDYGMDLNSDDSTDDENEPRKPVPAWADGSQLNQAILHQYYHPVNVDQLFGLIPSPKLEDIFGKSKPRYFKRTSSAVWHSPP
ncbi:INCE protein, partial [Psophia crepitans]|nr:INCE protein [Psophia crepitans]